MSAPPGVTSAFWSISVASPGQVVQGIDEINQCIAIIICTQPGSDPLRPLFGCGLGDLIDRPSGTVAPAMAAAMENALRLWETRIQVKKITYQVIAENIRFSITWALLVGAQLGEVQFTVGLLNGSAQTDAIPPATPYLSAVLATENNDPLTTETGLALQQQP